MYKKNVGTKWFKCDFHLHTNASKCFEDDDYTPEKFIQKVKDNNIQCIAITDHNTGKNIDIIKNAAKNTEITVFPGVEVTCTDTKIHILILFDIDKTTQYVEDFLLQKLNLNREKFGEDDAHVDMNISKVLSVIEKCGAIAIPAHIDEFNGLSLVADIVKKKIFNNGLVTAVQIVHEELLKIKLTSEEKKQLLKKLKEYYQIDTIDEEKINEWRKCTQYIKNIAKLTFSDNPNKEHSLKHGLWGIGKQYSWIKMKDPPCLESLRQAFLVPDLRVKNIFNSIECPYTCTSTWIKSLKFKNTEITRPEKEFTVEFNPQLNTIIGGRGSGKSSIIRFIRGVLKKHDDLDSIKSIKQEFKDFYQRYDRGTKNGVLNDNTEVTIEIFNKDIPYQITSKNINNINDQEIKIEKYDMELGKYIKIESIDYLTLMDVNIFSQKQIYEIAKSPNALLNKIDESIPELIGLKESKKQLSAEYLSISSEIRSLKERLEGKQRLQNEVSEIESRIKTLKESGITDLLNKNQIYSAEKEEIDSYINNVEEKISAFDSFIETIKECNFNTAVLKSEKKEVLNAIINKSQVKIDNIIKSLVKIKEDYQNLSIEVKKQVYESDWNSDREKYLDAIEKKKQELGEQNIKSIDMFQKLLTDKEEKQKQITALSKVEKEIEENKNKLDVKYKAIISISEEISECRKDFLQNILKGHNVQIKVNQYRDKESYEKEFRKIIQKDHEYTESIQNLIKKCFSGKLPEKLKEIHKDFYELRNDKSLPEYDGYFKNCINRLSPEQFDRLLLLVPEDEIYAQYKQTGSNKFKPISNASAGQKTATILTFILSYGDKPLILDQPEDDLDNHLVYDLIVDRLRESKDIRQIIVVTHNANIPVIGDSEYIIAMDSESPQLNILHQGTYR